MFFFFCFKNSRALRNSVNYPKPCFHVTRLTQNRRRNQINKIVKHLCVKMRKRRRPSPHLATRLTNAPELSARRFEVSTRAIRRKQASRESVNRPKREREKERSWERQNEILSSKAGCGGRGGKVGGGVCVVKFSGLYFPRSVGETPRNFTRTIFFRQCRPCRLRKRLVNEKTCVLTLREGKMQEEVHQRNPRRAFCCFAHHSYDNPPELSTPKIIYIKLCVLKIWTIYNFSVIIRIRIARNFLHFIHFVKKLFNSK